MKEVKVGMWESAPFCGAVSRSIDKVNDWLNTKKIPLYYSLNVNLNLDNIIDKAKYVDLLFLDGGEDVSPERYGNRNTYSRFNPNRDRQEFGILNAIEMRNPSTRVSGVCRGHQVISVKGGYTLVQDITMEWSRDVNHTKNHIARIKSDSMLARFIDDKEIEVSSMHHQAISPSNRGRKAWTLESVDGIPEGIELHNGKYRGVQSHPEFNMGSHDGTIFSYLMHLDYFGAEHIAKDADETSLQKLAKKIKEDSKNPASELVYNRYGRR